MDVKGELIKSLNALPILKLTIASDSPTSLEEKQEVIGQMVMDIGRLVREEVENGPAKSIIYDFTKSAWIEPVVLMGTLVNYWQWPVALVTSRQNVEAAKRQVDEWDGHAKVFGSAYGTTSQAGFYESVEEAIAALNSVI